MRILIGILVVFSSFFLAPIAEGQSKKELAFQIAQLAERLNALENRMLTGDPAAERLTQRMDALEASQRSLTGEIERLRFERDGLQEEVRALATELAAAGDLNEDIRRHLQAVNIVAAQAPVDGGHVYGGGRIGGGVYEDGSSIPGPPSIIGAPAAGSVGIDASQLASLGQDKMSEGDFTAAQTAFKQYLELNPDADDRGDIYFWLGETHYVKEGYADAADAYIASMRAAPDGLYAPDAMIRLAAAARALGQTDMACQTLNSFPNQYPKANAAVRAKARLEIQRSGC